MIISGLKEKDIKLLMKDYNIEGEIDRIAPGCMDDETLPLVTIGEIDGQCFCNINAEQKKRVFDFIWSISI
jgi:hypothetical protein